MPETVITGSIWSDWSAIEDAIASRSEQNSSVDRVPTSGLFGWVGYDGRFVFGVYPRVLAYDHDCQLWQDSGGLADDLPEIGDMVVINPVPQLHFVPCTTRDSYVAAVERAQNYISAGDIYQVNLAVQWEAHWPGDGDPFALYRRLRTVSPAPHSAYMHLQTTRVMSSSPECFLRMEGRQITTRPIKGTRPRFPEDAARDEASAHELASSPKERAELLMITDLERNDLGQVCDFGTVRVPELAAVETYAQVFHLVSTVTGTLRLGTSHAAALKACFPGGSITGAPKKRAREIIQELEDGQRGIYTGALGYFGFNQRSEFNIAIRTAVQQADKITFHTGSGIVADSIPGLEWEETLHKASGILQAGRSVVPL
ncbi:MAG: anthranilate synthase component I family protein [Verrucomicrobiaceae bacterium]|nr:anthranilate synthase component I family protein [Verrucomicrobiaceae bacterium]